MIYSNTSSDAILELERQRTGNYGEDDYNDNVHEDEEEDCRGGWQTWVRR